MKIFNDKKTQAEQFDDAENLLQLKDVVKSEPKTEQADVVMIPIPLTLALKISREHRVLRKIVIEFIRKNKLPGFENLGKDMPTTSNHNQLYDSKGRLIAKLTPEEIVENEKPVEPVYPKQYTLDELRLLKEAAKAEDVRRLAAKKESDLT